MNRENRFSSDINNLELEQNQFQNTQQRNAQQPFQSNSSQQNLQSQVPQIVLNSQQKKQMFQKQQIQHITQENITDNKNLVIQTQGPSFKNSLGVQHTFNLSPYVNTDQQNEENKFTFEKIDNQNRDKVDSYQSATFRKGSELIYSQTNQMGSISSLQNDQNMTNSQYIAQQLVGSKQNNFQKSSIVLNSTFVNQNQQQSNISQNYSSIQDPYLVLTNKNVSTKQFMQKLKECLQSDYDNKIVGLLKFAQIYMKFQEGKFIQNQSLQAEATQIYDDSFQIPLKNNQQDFSQQFLHDYQKMFLYQKSVGLGMTAQRQACIQNGQICQPIEDKSKCFLFQS